MALRAALVACTCLFVAVAGRGVHELGRDTDTPSKMSSLNEWAERQVQQKVADEMARRERLKTAGDQLQLQKAQERENKAQLKVDQLAEEEEAQRKKLAQLAIEQQNLKAEATRARLAASSPAMARKIALEYSAIANKMTRRVRGAEERLNELHHRAKSALADTLVKDQDAKNAQALLMEAEKAVDTAAGAAKTLKASSSLKVAKIHRDLAKLVSEYNRAVAMREQAEQVEAQAEKSVVEAGSGGEKLQAEVKLAAARSKLSQAKAEEAIHEKSKHIATVRAGSKQMAASLQVASAEANLKTAQLHLSNAKVKATQADQAAAAAQKHAAKLSVKSSVLTTELRKLRDQAESASLKATNAEKMHLPTVAREVATKKSVAVNSTNSKMRQAEIKVISCRKKKEEALEALATIRTVVRRLSSTQSATNATSI